VASDSGPGWVADGRAIRAVRQDQGASVDTSRWPATVPAVEQMLCEGLELPSGLTVLVGENGSGNNPGRRPERRFHELSHGEGFLEILLTRVNQPGFYLMDEPDAPLSFTASLGLVALLHDLVRAGSQAIVATHSPIVAAVPGARILELGDWGMRPAGWEELHLVGAWRRFMAEPASYLRHLLAD
jgi:predicted ATPase